MPNLDGKKTWPIFIVFAIVVLGIVGYYSWCYYKDISNVNVIKIADTGTELTKTDVSSSWKSYDNETIGYSIKYPGNWIVKENQGDKKDTIIQDRAGIIRGNNEGVKDPNKIDGSCVIVASMAKESSLTLIQYLEKIVDNGKWEEIIVGDNYKGYKLVTPSGLTGGIELVYVAKDNLVVGFALNVTIAKDEAKSSDYFNEMLTSFKFVQKTTQTEAQDKMTEKTYTNNKIGIKFNYPDDWILEEDSSVPGVNTMYLTLFKIGTTKNTSKIIICMGACGHGLHGFEKTSSKSLVANGLNWTLDYWTGFVEDNETGKYLIVAPIPTSSANSGDGIEVYYTDDNKDIYTNTFEEIINTFTIDK